MQEHPMFLNNGMCVSMRGNGVLMYEQLCSQTLKHAFPNGKLIPMWKHSQQHILGFATSIYN
jgi:hypothetical protein